MQSNQSCSVISVFSSIVTPINNAGSTIPTIAPKGTLNATIVVALAISYLLNQTIASLLGTEMMNPYPNPPIAYVMMYIIRLGKATQSQKANRRRAADIHAVN